MIKNLLALIFILTAIAIDGFFKDDTRTVQNMINSAKKGGIIDGKNKTFHITAIWLKSNITIQNFNFISVPTTESDVSIVNIGNDLATNNFNTSAEARQSFKMSSVGRGLENIIIKNIKIDGNRSLHNAKEIRDGGKHGIAIKGFCNNIHLENIVVKNCVTDGIAIYRGVHTTLESNDKLFAANNITIINMQSSNNRRHGGSGDSINNFLCKNSSFNKNGSDSEGFKTGAKAAIFNNSVYGNGWDMEGYGIGSSINNIIFDNCSFLENAAAGLLFYDTVDQNDKTFISRKNIKISNSKIDAGLNNPSGNYALIFTSTIENKKNLKKLYSDVQIINTFLYGKLLLRSVDNVKLADTKIISRESVQGLIDYSDNIYYSFRNNKNTINWESYNGKNIQ